MVGIDGERTPGFKLFLTILVGLALTIPLFSVWLLVYDRQSQSTEATESITAGWGGPQAMTGPVSACGPPHPAVIDSVASVDCDWRS